MLLLAVLLAAGTFLVPAFPAEAAKSTRTAQVLEVQGDVHITKSGGTKQFRVFKGMTLNQGDYLVTGSGAKVVLLVADREEEVTIGEHASLYISELSESADGKKSKFKLWAGSVWNKVSALLGAEDEFEVETPTAVMGVRGTQFYVVVDPLTNAVTVTTASGLVAAGPAGADKAALVLPLRVFRWFAEDRLDEPDDAVTFLDFDAFFEAATVDVIEKMVLETARLHEEIEKLRETWTENPDIGEPPAPEDVTNVFTHLLLEGMNRGVLTREHAEAIVSRANGQIPVESRQFDLDRDPAPLEQTAGVNWEEEAQKRQQREEAEARNRELRNTLENDKQENQANHPALAEQVEQTREQQQAANEQTDHERSQAAVENYKSNLTETQRQQLDQRMAEREEERRAQQESAGQNAGQQPGGSGGTGGSGNTGGQPGGGSGGGSDNKPAAKATVRNVAPVQGEPYVDFTLDLELENITGLFGVQLHVTIPELIVDDQMDPWSNSDIFGESDAVNWKAEEVLVNGDSWRTQLILSAMRTPDAQPVSFSGKKLLVSVTLRFNAYEYPTDSFPVLLHLILSDDNGDEIEVEFEDAHLQVDIPVFNFT
jgi:hypothetical protein